MDSLGMWPSFGLMYSNPFSSPISQLKSGFEEYN